MSKLWRNSNEWGSYCSHCGTVFRRDNDNYDVTHESRPKKIVKKVPITSFIACLYEFNISEITINAIKRDLNVSKVKNATVNIGQEFPDADLDITFIRENKYFETVDSLIKLTDIVLEVILQN